MTPNDERVIANVAKAVALLRAIEILVNESPPTSIEASIYLAGWTSVLVKTARKVGALDVVDEASALGFAGAVKLAERNAENERLRRN